MLPFRSFIVEKTYELSPQENKQVENILNEYQKFFSSEALGDYDPQEVYKKHIQNDMLPIGTIKYLDKETNEEGTVSVYVSFEKFAADASYEQEDNIIVLYYRHYNRLSTIMKRNKIVHELFHAKQHYKTLTSGYKRAIHKRTLPSGLETIRSERGYFFSPNEYPVQLASLTHEMDRQYMLILQNLKRGLNRKFWENQKAGFLKLLDQFIRAPKLVNDQDLPNYLKNEKRFIKALFRNKDDPKYSKYYKDFKTKLYFYHQKLKGISKKKLDDIEEVS
jgi:hypothetical protein